ncbi:hypothetical protein D3C76_1638590 [compost metagenome]
MTLRIAVSAFLISATASKPSFGYTLMPRLAVTLRSWPSMGCGELMAASSLSATPLVCCGSMTSPSTTTNSSEP